MSLILMGQLLGLMSFCIGLIAFTKKNDHHLKITMAFLFLCQTAYFFCMGSQTGMVTSFVSLIRTILSIRFHSLKLGVFLLWQT
ncbi:MAG: YgjV family protein [Gammaproteobacteria bacterium]|nr:YgjV family protein [Gammaproteobacteria bacterium]